MGNSVWLILILVLNFGISWWNCYSCGRAWVEAKAVGGMMHVMVWCGAIQAAIGFSSVFLFPLIFAAHAIFPEYFTDLYVKGAVNLWYLTIIVPILGTGIIITVESWIAAYRDRSLLNMGVAGWNTFAQVHNTVSAINNMGSAFSAVGDAFGSLFDVSDDDAKDTLAKIGLVIMIVVVILALFAGTMLTVVLIKRYAGTMPMPARTRMSAAAARGA